jgi:hypothetical protein
LSVFEFFLLHKTFENLINIFIRVQQIEKSKNKQRNHSFKRTCIGPCCTADQSTGSARRPSTASCCKGLGWRRSKTENLEVGSLKNEIDNGYLEKSKFLRSPARQLHRLLTLSHAPLSPPQLVSSKQLAEVMQALQSQVPGKEPMHSPLLPHSPLPSRRPAVCTEKKGNGFVSEKIFF